MASASVGDRNVPSEEGGRGKGEGKKERGGGKGRRRGEGGGRRRGGGGGVWKVMWLKGKRILEPGQLCHLGTESSLVGVFPLLAHLQKSVCTRCLTRYGEGGVVKVDCENERE